MTPRRDDAIRSEFERQRLLAYAEWCKGQQTADATRQEMTVTQNEIARLRESVVRARDLLDAPYAQWEPEPPEWLARAVDALDEALTADEAAVLRGKRP